ncbi:chloride channel protein [Pedobacter aquatilis]|uniref:chloride channel protein n=1 Tax=Pedobacter aquatilis TaxID=351343 RepID=UPI00292DF093|nr:chloride channel protein [Pedobacter aquatilis]
MSDNNHNRIPISPALDLFKRWRFSGAKEKLAKKRLFYISLLSIGVALLISMVAKVLVSLINLVTNISFFGHFDWDFHSPAENQLGYWVIIIPVIGGGVVGLMALYGSKAIRGHGIPEAMEQVLTNQSKIKPMIAILKPVSSAIAIGTGGPFGAEGPIIATGGALGSTLGQLIRVTPNERKVILAAGATAGMSAIFGTPIAAVFLAIELLLFEFSPRAIIPVALACITGAAGHHLFFESGPVFPMPALAPPSNQVLFIYSVVGVVIGLLSVGLTRVVYFIEDLFEKLPIHWMWWPAIGGLAVGLIGYFAPHTLGVGYENITNLLSGKVPLAMMLSLCLLKFLSWSLALGSGTSGGTLAPLMTIGGATGAIIGYAILSSYPQSGISISACALVGMSAMFAGASRAYLTSILFALEATHQINGLLPLLCACSGAYLVSFFLMENTIMTEKIARRGVYTPDAYEPDPMMKTTISQVLKKSSPKLLTTDTIDQVRTIIGRINRENPLFAVTDVQGNYKGTLNVMEILDPALDSQLTVSTFLKNEEMTAQPEDSLRKAMELMSANNRSSLAIKRSVDGAFLGLLTYNDVLSCYHSLREADGRRGRSLDLGRARKKIILKNRMRSEKNKLN